MSKVHFPTASAAGLALSLLLCGAVGCNSGTPKEVVLSPAQNSLRNLATGYWHATNSLKRPPRNADEAKPFLAKLGDPQTLLKSPSDGTDLVVQWGTDLLKQQDGQYLVWAYEKNASGGKRWVIQGRHPVEMTDAQLGSVPFAPGMKKPI